MFFTDADVILDSPIVCKSASVLIQKLGFKTRVTGTTKL